MPFGKENLSSTFLSHSENFKCFWIKPSVWGLYAWLKMALQISIFYLSLQSQITLVFQV